MKAIVTRAMLAAGFITLSAAAPALGQDFHGFDPQSFDGAMLSSDQLQAMVAEAKETTPPKNGDTYTFGFANLQRDIAFGILVEQGIQENADAAGIDLQIADNRLDGPTALSNAQSFAQRNVDYAIEFQTDVNFGPTVMEVFNQADIPVTAIDIPMPGATFFGANNPRSGFMGGSYLAQAAIAEFGEEAVANGYFVVGDLPQSGAIPAMRTEGQVAGFEAVLPDFPQDQIIRIDTKNTLQESFTQMSNVIGRIPADVPIMITAINDQATIGMIRAVTQAGRDSNAIAVGNGADELQTLMDEPRMVASVGYFPERYGNFLIPIALAELAGHEVPPAVLQTHYMITPANICEYYEDYTCEGEASFEYSFPQDAFEAHLESLAGNPDLAGYETLIPSE